MSEAAPALQVHRVSKRFGGVRALSEVSVSFMPGEVHALLGENGAGKSTLMKIIAGVSVQDEGTVAVPGGSIEEDVAMVFQELSLLPELSVEDNLLLGLRSRGLAIQRKVNATQAESALLRAGLDNVNLRAPVSALSLAQRQLLEIARGLLTDPKVLILDEPTATLSDVEIQRIHKVVGALRDEGRSIIYITHRLGEVFKLADAITVMRNGQVVSSGQLSDFTMDRIYEDMLGPDHEERRKREDRSSAVSDGPVVLELTGVESSMTFADVNMAVRSGEVVALLGQVGSGADSLAQALVGLVPISRGRVELDGRTLGRITRVNSQRNGIAYVSADRVLEGVFLQGAVATNISSGALRRVINKLRLLSSSREKALAIEYARTVHFDESRVGSPVITLSGGNQQKVAIARALAAQPRVLVLVEPTRGVDVGARAEIYRSLRDLTSRGMAIVIYTSDSTEVFDLADRVLTMFRGHLVGEHAVSSTTDAELLAEILHGGLAA